MDIRIYKKFPPQAMEIRNKVFVEEQGFVDEFDDVDAAATHLVAFSDTNEAIATCRVFLTKKGGEYTLGRFCVRKAYRGRHIGRRLLEAAEREVASRGGTAIVLHSQLQAKGFYEKCGYVAEGEIEYEQNHPHVLMKKERI